jgi:hypothetical protein
MRMQSSHVEDYEGDEEEGFAWMHLRGGFCLDASKKQ